MDENRTNPTARTRVLRPHYLSSEKRTRRPRHLPSLLTSDPFQIVYLLILVSIVTGMPALFGVRKSIYSGLASTMIVMSLVIGAGFVWLVVRTLNRRDDPRYAKRPPDAP